MSRQRTNQPPTVHQVQTAARDASVMRRAAVRIVTSDRTAVTLASAEVLNSAAERLTEHPQATGRMTRSVMELARAILATVPAPAQAPVTQVAGNVVVVRPDSVGAFLDHVNQSYSEASQD